VVFDELVVVVVAVDGVHVGSTINRVLENRMGRLSGAWSGMTVTHTLNNPSRSVDCTSRE
jgi:hypothetical protein